MLRYSLGAPNFSALGPRITVPPVGPPLPPPRTPSSWATNIAVQAKQPTASTNTSGQAAINNLDATANTGYTQAPGGPTFPNPLTPPTVIVADSGSGMLPTTPTGPTMFAPEPAPAKVGISGLGIAAIGAGLVGLYLIFGR